MRPASWSIAKPIGADLGRFAPLAIALAVGCTAAEHTTDPTNSETTFEAGTLNGVIAGRIGSPQTTNSDQVTLTGIVGNFTRLSISGVDAGAGPSRVYFSTRGDSGGVPHLWQVNIDGSGLRQLTTQPSGQVLPSISGAGNRLVYRDLGLSGGQPSRTDLWEWTPTAGTRFLAAETGVNGLAGWLPGDSAIIYPVHAAGDNGLRQRGLAGGAILRLTEEPDSQVTTGLVHGVPTAFFIRRDSLYRMNLTTRDTSLFTVLEPFYGTLNPALSPDGRQVLLWIEFLRGFTLFTVPTALPDSFVQAGGVDGDFRTWKPEARWSGDTAVVWTEPEAGTETPNLHWVNLKGGKRRLTNFPAGVETGFTVGPFLPPPPRTLIGEGGELGSRASGIIYGVGPQSALTTVVSFTASPQRSLSLKAETGLDADAPVLTYMLTADRLTSLGYLAGDGPVVSVIDSSSAPVSGALVSFDGRTGQVALILPFAGEYSRAAVVSDDGQARVFRGLFTGVWQDGRNLAPSGTREVRLNFRSGRVEIAR
jgi:hypothetical protein